MKRISILCLQILFCHFVLAQDFQNVTLAYGIDEGCGNCSFGGGVSFVDFNQDGWDDITFGTQAGDSISFYINNNGLDFIKIASLVDHTDISKQVLWSDYDNDGDYDLFVASLGKPNKLYENDGNLNMTNVTTAAGLPTTFDDMTYGATFGDYNNDGWLDLYVTNQSIFSMYTNYMYRNNGDGTFTDVTTSTGTSDNYEFSLTAGFLDINNDGWQDLYNSQDRNFSQNSLFKNNGDSTFTEISGSSNTDLAIDAMNVGVADFDQDGDLDIYVTNTPQEGGSSFLRNNGNETFTDIAEDQGVRFANRIGWAGTFFDCENDGDLDLYVCGMNIGAAYGNALYIRDMENDTFIELNPPNMLGDTSNSFANAMADFNHDGLTDIVVTNANIYSSSPKHLLWENMDTSGLNWIKINLEGVESNRDGVGSWIEVWNDTVRQIVYTQCGNGYLSQNSNTQLIGLDTFTTVDSIIVKWLSGHTNKLYNIVANQTLDIVEQTVPLDVELMTFTARVTNQLSVELNWATASEEFNKGFHLQRSQDGKNFNNIQWIDGYGTVESVRLYEYEDKAVLKQNTYYYRLRQLDYDGSIAYSDIVSVKLGGDDEAVGHFYPNPTSNQQIAINLFAQLNQTAEIELYNLQGDLVAYQSYNINEGTNAVYLDLAVRVPGIYFAKVVLNFETYFRKLVIEK